MKKILLIGANGQLGNDIVTVLGEQRRKFDLTPLTHADIEITDPQSIEKAFGAVRPDIVLDTAAFHKLEKCEADPERTFAVNALGTRNLALACRSVNAALVFMSSDYVFGGDEARRVEYSESDPPAPLNVYGVSKLAGEHFARYLMDRFFILRVSGLYGISGSSGKGGNFVELMLRLAGEGKDIKVVNDQTLTPTYTVDLARQIELLLDTERYGLYHATSHGMCTWYEFAAEIFRQTGVRANLSPTTTDCGSGVLRPRFSALDNAALRATGLDCMRPWQESLAAYLRERRIRTAGAKV